VLGDRVTPAHRSAGLYIAASLGLIGVLAVAARAAVANYYGVDVAPSRTYHVEEYLRQQAGVAAASGGLVLVERDLEGAALDGSTYRIALSHVYDVFDLDHQEPGGRRATGRPRLVYGDVLGNVAKLRRSIDACDAVYEVNTVVQEPFDEFRRSLAASCGHPIRYALLPA
jgi:hypothetical protein